MKSSHPGERDIGQPHLLRIDGDGFAWGAGSIVAVDAGRAVGDRHEVYLERWLREMHYEPTFTP